MPRREDYKTRREYKWAKKLANREHARQTAPWRYPAAFAGILVGMLTGSVVDGILALAASAVFFHAAIQDWHSRSERRRRS